MKENLSSHKLLDQRVNGHSKPGDGRVLITGGAGFIGSNLAHRLLSEGRRVTVFDNLARPGVRRNVEWLLANHGDRITVRLGDVRDAEAVAEVVDTADTIYHLAAQVAVTTSLDEPRTDFDVNVAGTLNILEAARARVRRPAVVFTSTNKVYGDCAGLSLERGASRYAPTDRDRATYGLGEDTRISFESPYGCSKGAADQYVLDYARSYGLTTAVFRMSCIYGPRQFGNEDQGWVAHFLLRALRDEPITLYGDGRQVRDLLFVDDLVEALVRASRVAPAAPGEVFNIGGGPERAVSLLELLDLIEELTAVRPRVTYSDWRRGDQRYYVSDCRKAARLLGWEPRTTVRQGLAKLVDWMRRERLAEAAAVERAAAAPAAYSGTA